MTFVSNHSAIHLTGDHEETRMAGNVEIYWTVHTIPALCHPKGPVNGISRIKSALLANIFTKPGMVAHNCNLSTQEAEEGGSGV